jgi:hypothetical protein
MTVPSLIELFDERKGEAVRERHRDRERGFFNTSQAMLCNSLMRPHLCDHPHVHASTRPICSIDEDSDDMVHISGRRLSTQCAMCFPHKQLCKPKKISHCVGCCHVHQIEVIYDTIDGLNAVLNALKAAGSS